MTISRRYMIGSVAGAAAGAVASKAVLKAASELTSLTSVPIRPPRGPEAFHTGICTECASGCGTRVRTIGDRAVFVGGNPEHPLNRGGMCPRGLGSLHGHYHPDRLLKVLERADKAGDLASTDWDSALQRLSTRLTALRDAGSPERFGVLHEKRNDPFGRLVGDFLRAFGSPNDLVVHPVPAQLRSAWRRSHGSTGEFAYDIERAGLVLGFSADLLEGFGSPGHALHAFGRLRQRAQTNRGRWVQVEPRLSVTGSRADQRIAVRPGTEGIFALGLAYVLIAERLYDADFVATHVTGFDEFTDDQGTPRQGFREWVLENFFVSRVSQQTGVAAEIIMDLARQLPRYAPTVAIPGRAAALSDNGEWTCWAIHSLNALLGSIGVEGGVHEPLPPPYGSGSEFELDPIAAAGLSKPRFDHDLAVGLAAGIEPDPIAGLLNSDSTEPPLDVLVVIDCDPVALSPAPDQMIAALDRIPLVVVLTAHPNETTAHADLVLPSPSVLERWDMVANPPLTPYTVCGLRRPVLEQRGDTRHPGDVLIGLAGNLGDPTAAVAPWDSYEGCLRASVDGLFEARRGDVFGIELDASYTRLMQSAGLWTPSYRTSGQLWTQMQERGGWWDPTPLTGEQRRMLQTPSGKFEIMPRDKPSAMVVALDDDYPLLLFPFEVLAVAHGRFNDTPFLRSLSGPHFDGPMHAWVELNPETAEELGLHEDERVVVESEFGEVEARLRVYEGLEPGMAAMPLGMGRTAGRWSGNWGVNALTLVGAPRGRDARGQYSTPVRVRRA